MHQETKHQEISSKCIKKTKCISYAPAFLKGGPGLPEIFRSWSSWLSLTFGWRTPASEGHQGGHLKWHVIEVSTVIAAIAKGALWRSLPFDRVIWKQGSSTVWKHFALLAAMHQKCQDKNVLTPSLSHSSLVHSRATSRFLHWPHEVQKGHMKTGLVNSSATFSYRHDGGIIQMRWGSLATTSKVKPVIGLNKGQCWVPYCLLEQSSPWCPEEPNKWTKIERYKMKSKWTEGVLLFDLV